VYWSLHGLASHIPANMGSESSSGHRVNAPAAISVGRRGSYGCGAAGSRAQDDSLDGLLWTVPERERQQGGRGLRQCEEHA